jgi:hypothetical protein
MVALEGVMETPEELQVMRQLLERGWSRRLLLVDGVDGLRGLPSA